MTWCKSEVSAECCEEAGWSSGDLLTVGDVVCPCDSLCEHV